MRSGFLHQPCDQRHPDRHAGGGLLEINRARIGVELVREFVGARQRMHHDGFMVRLVRSARASKRT